jgi:isoaspartyl peptidase/L-asparaginase-like protein (Ntn-hydrolase superfamily)
MPAPLIVSTWSFGQRGNDAAWPLLARGGHSIDAVEKVCEVVDADPEVDSVGFGGLPDASGHVSLDGCIMLAPNRCGSVCAVRRFMHPVSLARRVMEKTNHVMLAGAGADVFAEHEGFMPADLLSADAQDAYEKWKKDHGIVDQTRDKGYARKYLAPRPIDQGEANRPHASGRGSGKLFFHPAPADDVDNASDESKWKHHDTIGVLALDSHGVLAGGCSTSGTPFKLPGRVGDSPIIGHGLYVDPDHGAVVATGTGELIMGVCGSFLAVEMMRRGASPIDALRETLQRIIDSYELKPEHQVAMIAMRPDGAFASAALRAGYKTSVRKPERSEVIEPDLVMIK